MLRLFCIVLIMLCVFVVFLSSDVAHLRTGVRASSIAEQWQYAHHIVLRDSFLSFFVCVCRWFLILFIISAESSGPSPVSENYPVFHHQPNDMTETFSGILYVMCADVWPWHTAGPDASYLSLVCSLSSVSLASRMMTGRWSWNRFINGKIATKLFLIFFFLLLLLVVVDGR